MYVGVSGAFSGADFLEAMVLEPMMPQPTMLRKAVLIPVPGDQSWGLNLTDEDWVFEQAAVIKVLKCCYHAAHGSIPGYRTL